METLSQRGYTMKHLEEDRAAIFITPDGVGRATVVRPDAGDYHQAGWDIQIIVTTEHESRCYFLEGKTHTPRSRVRSLLPLSNEQMRMAAEKGKDYILLEVIYDETSGRALELHPVPNVLELISRGRCITGRGAISCPTAGTG